MNGGAERKNERVDWRFVWDRAQWGLLLVPTLAWAVVVSTFWSLELGSGQFTDVLAYHRAAEAVRAGGSPYFTIPPPGPHTAGEFYLYPPPFAALLALTGLSYEALYRVLTVAAVLGFLALAWATARLTGRGWRAAFVVWGAIGFYTPAYAIIWMGNVQSWVQGLAALALLASPLAAGALLAFGGVVKVTPAWALFVVLARERRGWAGAGAALVASAIVTVFALGLGGTIDACLTWVRDVGPTLAQGQFSRGPGWVHTWNISPTFAPLYLLVRDPGAGNELPGWARLYLTTMQLAGPLAAAWLTRGLDWRGQAGWVLVAATITAPILRPGFLPVLLLVPALLLRQRSRTVAGSARSSASRAM